MTQPPSIPCAVLLGTPVDDVTMAEALDVIAALVADGRATGACRQVTTVNVDFVVNAMRDAGLRSVMQRAALNVPDGMGVVWGARWLGTPLRERTSGADLVPALVSRAAQQGWRLALFGGAPGVAEQAATVLARAAPGADVVGVPAPQVGPRGEMDRGVALMLREIDADVVGVALGNPKQEHWIARWGPDVGSPVCIGIGGTLDFLTGVTTRAPVWMQRNGLEWIHRAASSPRRLAGRYAKDLVVYAPALLRQRWLGRRRTGSDPVVTDRDGTRALDLGGLEVLDNRTVAVVAAEVRAAARERRSVTVSGVGRGVAASADRLRVGQLLTGAAGDYG